jgi:predicted DNA-binding transcriptional regulator YafY
MLLVCWNQKYLQAFDEVTFGERHLRNERIIVHRILEEFLWDKEGARRGLYWLYVSGVNQRASCPLVYSFVNNIGNDK